MTQSKLCANFVYDLNGSKGPNTVGKFNNIWTSSVISTGEDGKAWNMSFYAGDIKPDLRSNNNGVHCIKR